MSRAIVREMELLTEISRDTTIHLFAVSEMRSGLAQIAISRAPDDGGVRTATARNAGHAARAAPTHADAGARRDLPAATATNRHHHHWG